MEHVVRGSQIRVPANAVTHRRGRKVRRGAQQELDECDPRQPRRLTPWERWLRPGKCGAIAVVVASHGWYQTVRFPALG